ncbi:MAG: metallophosphatase family protein [Bacteroidia bacterium]|nr:metallophosphatase family protein [Bacteroidia bacterium]
MKLAIISDTHRLLRPSLLKYLTDVDLVLHAGDIGSIKVITELKELVPTLAVIGNVDVKPWSKTIPKVVEKKIEGVSIKMVHDPENIPAEWYQDGTDIIIYGHTHKALETKKENVLMLNPGSVGPKRFDLSITFMLMNIEDGKFSYEWVELED